ncbi:MAG TPA: type I-E CRISPR-associated protein Cse1/CasA [Thermoanaerobaculia bacterium]
MNLVRDPWIPIRRRSGAEERIAPWQITDRLDSDPVIALAAPRPDFDGALAQLWIGLLQTALPPARSREWRQRFDSPPSPEELRAALEPLAFAFELFGDGPRFLQDLTLEESDAVTRTVEWLLIEVAGFAEEEGKGHFVRSGEIKNLCAPCAAAALFTVQTDSPSGGRGHRTGLRGGGPLTTLVVTTGSLWESLWLNVLDAGSFPAGNPDRDRPEDRFPWLAPTRTSEAETGRDTTFEDVHPLQMFWGMPRRVRLLPEPGQEAGCDLCAGPADPVVRQCLARHSGVNYSGPWSHPLTPYYKDAKGQVLPRHGDRTGLGYRHWLGFVVKDGERTRPAAVVDAFLSTRDRHTRADFRLWAFGYAMDNMKALAWSEGTMPLFTVPEETREVFEAESERWVLAAKEAENALSYAVKRASARNPKDLKGDFAAAGSRFWQETEPPFWQRLETLQREIGPVAAPPELREQWFQDLDRTARRIFHALAGSAGFDVHDPQRVAAAYHGLRKALWKIHDQTLGLPRPARERTATGATA